MKCIQMILIPYTADKKILSHSLLHHFQKMECPAQTAAAPTPCSCLLQGDADPLIHLLTELAVVHQQQSLFGLFSFEFTFEYMPFSLLRPIDLLVNQSPICGTKLPGPCNQASTLPLSHNPDLSV